MIKSEEIAICMQALHMPKKKLNSSCELFAADYSLSSNIQC